MLVLSLFPGIDLFGRAFEAEGFCVVRGPDLLWGGDVRRFNPPAGAFWGVFGGSPCQDFSGARRSRPSGQGLKLLAEFGGVVSECLPEWFLLENVPRVPDLRVRGWNWQRFEVNQGWYSGVNRLRHFQFGSRSGVVLHVERGRPCVGLSPAALANDGRGFREVCRLQGLPEGFDLPGFTVSGKIAAVGNGVPFVLGRVVARSIREAYGLDSGDGDLVFDRRAVEVRRCACGCGRVIRGRQIYASACCRKRAERRRRGVTSQRLDL